MAFSSTPRRREERKTHLDASVVPVERALFARAAALEKFSADNLPAPGQLTAGVADALASQVVAGVAAAMAAEFIALAEELHYW